CYSIPRVKPADTGEYCVRVHSPCFDITNCVRLTVYGALGDFVWFDRNTNGVQDVTELGVPGVTVQLMDCASGQILRTTNTDANGLYLFIKVAPGDYKVTFTNLPAGYQFTIPD